MLFKPFTLMSAMVLALGASASLAQERLPLAGQAPLYLSGIVSTILWGEPGARMDVQARRERTAPEPLLDMLVRRPGVDLGKAEKTIRAAVAASDNREWRVRLPSLAQLSLADIPRPEVGSSVTVVGYPAPSNDGTPTLNATVLMMGGAAYALPPVAQGGSN